MGAQHSHLLYQIPSPPTYDKDLDDLCFISAGGMEIPIVHKEWKDEDGNTAIFTLLYMSSHYHDLGMCMQWLKTIQLTLRVNIVAFEYPGYGLHVGEPCENSLYSCASVVFSYVKDTLQVPTDRIILIGKSLGTAVAINLACEIENDSKKTNEKLAGMILITPFTSLVHIVGSRLKMTKADLFDSSKKLEKITVPVFGVHGETDEVVDVKHGQKTISRMQNVWKFTKADAGHHDIDFSDDFMDNLILFLDFIGERVPEYIPRIVKQRVIPSQYRREQTVDNWLQSIRLDKYSQKFLVNGYFSMDVVKTLEKIDLEAMDIQDEDQEAIMSSVLSLLSGGDGTPQRLEETKNEAPEKEEKVISYGPMDVDAKSFNQILVEQNCSPIGLSENGIPAAWDDFMAFASSINIPEWEHEDDVVLSIGLFGEVIKSTWNDRTVVKRRLQYKKNQFQKFCKEAVILSQLKHPNIVEVFGACMKKDVCPCIITEYIEGERLSDYLVTTNESLTNKQRIEIGKGIVRGLLYLHNCKPPIVHRDLTPNNIFICENLHVKLTDFGLGRPPSFLYMAPELFSKQPYSTAVDIYSLGLVLYFVFTGSPPFEGLRGAEAAAKSAKLNVRPSLPQSTPVAWKTLITSCWHKNPALRPTAAQALESLQKMDESGDSDKSTEENQLSDTPISLIGSPDSAFGADPDEFTLEKLPFRNLHAGAGLLSYQLMFLVNDPKYADFTICVGEERIAAHRAVLAARSDIFAAQIDQLAVTESRELHVDQTLVTPSAMLSILQFLYSGHLTLHCDNVLEIMNAANNLNIVQAVDICREYLADYGVPISANNTPANENTERIRDVKESLSVAEMSIQNVENVLDVLNSKLESVTQRMNSLPTLYD